MSQDWLSFWQSYRNIEPLSEDDLFIQVGKTVARKPISKDIFDSMISRIVDHLDLRVDDEILDLCCGNGLISFEISQHVERLIGVDFADHLIAGAIKFKSRPNIIYRTADVTSPIHKLIDETPSGDLKRLPNKYLMNDALAYFSPQTLGIIFDNICIAKGSDSFRFLITGIPDGARKWNFYNTPDRKSRYLEKMAQGDETNDGIGRWWEAEEIELLCAQRGLAFQLFRQPDSISKYRMDTLISRGN